MTANWKIVRSTLVWLLIALMTMGIVIASPYTMKSQAAAPKQTVTVAKASNGKWGAVKNGKIDTSVNGVYKNQYGWWYVKKGLVQFDYNGIQKNQYGWWRIEKGKVNFDATGIFKNEYGWWRVEDGKVNFNATSIYKNDYGWWRVEDGKVNFKANGIYKNNYGWWKTSGGKVTFKENGVFKNEYGWWKVVNSKVDFGFTGIASNKYGTWYLEKGKVDFKANKVVEFEGTLYLVTDGKATIYKEDVTPVVPDKPDEKPVDPSEDTTPSGDTTPSDDTTPVDPSDDTKPDEDKTKRYAEAVSAAKAVSDEAPVSRAMLIDLLEEEGFTKEEATYGADNAEINWYTNALLASAEVLGDWTEGEYFGVSEDLYLQLMKDPLLYTEDEIEYAHDIVNKDANKGGAYWKNQCRTAAEEFQKYCAENKDVDFNKENLTFVLEQLLFTNNQVTDIVKEFFPN